MNIMYYVPIHNTLMYRQKHTFTHTHKHTHTLPPSLPPPLSLSCFSLSHMQTLILTHITCMYSTYLFFLRHLLSIQLYLMNKMHFVDTHTHTHPPLSRSLPPSLTHTHTHTHTHNTNAYTYIRIHILCITH